MIICALALFSSISGFEMAFPGFEFYEEKWTPEPAISAEARKSTDALKKKSSCF